MLIIKDEINISAMSLEELEKARAEARTIITSLDHAIIGRKMANRKHNFSSASNFDSSKK